MDSESEKEGASTVMETIDRYVETALRVHEFNIAEAAATCRQAAQWWLAVNPDTAARWQRVADALDALALNPLDKSIAVC